MRPRPSSRRLPLLALLLVLPFTACGSGESNDAANSFLKATPAAKRLLDTNGNGVACEAKFGVTGTSATPRPNTRSTSPRTTSSRSTGSRGTSPRGTSPRGGASSNGSDCAAAALQAGRFDPSCPAYQGYLDPGARAGRAPTSGERQYADGCKRGYIPKSRCG